MRDPGWPPIDVARIRAIAAGARGQVADHPRGANEPSATLTEPDARSILEAMGIAVPQAVYLAADSDRGDAALAAAELAGERVVVRVVAPAIAHKTEVGGVAVVPRDPAAIGEAIAGMRDRLAGQGLSGFMVAAFVDHDPGIGGSLLVSARWTDDLGPVVSVGAGGIDAEALAADLRPGREIAILSPTLTRREDVEEVLRASTAVRLATEGQRGRPARLPVARLVDVVERFLAVADACLPEDLLELEVNPIVVTPDGLVALDVLAVPGPGPAIGGTTAGTVHGRPVAKLARFYEPRSVALIGVSAGMNPGHIILGNLLRDGFDPARVTVVKPGADEIDGCRCVPGIASLPAKVDLFVVAVSAAQASGVVADIVERDAAETVLVIPGGLEEKEGSGAIVARMLDALAAARERPGGGPLVNGGNCLGFRSVKGRIDTMFIPASKLAPPGEHVAPLAIVAQSGAFAITRLSRLPAHPVALVTVGNQMDLTIGDHVAYLADDPGIAVFGVYLEGFRPLDAATFLAAARRIADRGGTVVLYHAGRTAAGVRASASHTAAIAGDVAATRALARQAGVLVAASLDEFDDLLRAATILRPRAIEGRRVAALSNAGMECVVIGDSVGSLQLPPFDAATAGRLGEVLAATGAGSVVDVHNPLDATPMAGDGPYLELAAAILDAPGVDVGVVGVVPLAATVQTLAPGPGHAEDLAAPGAVAAGLVALWRRTSKAWVVVIDGGPLYDPLAAALEAGGLPVFRTADRAMRALEAIVRHRLGDGAGRG